MSIGRWYLFSVIASLVLNYIADKKIENYIKKRNNPINKDMELKIWTINFIMKTYHFIRAFIPVINFIYATINYFNADKEKIETEEEYLKKEMIKPKIIENKIIPKKIKLDNLEEKLSHIDEKLERLEEQRNRLNEELKERKQEVKKRIKKKDKRD